MARVLILRQASDAAETAVLLRDRGHAPQILPTQETRVLDEPPPDGPFSGFVVTSANAVAGLARHWPEDRRPVLAVGERTAEALRRAGYASVHAGKGTAASLAGEARRLAGDAAPLLYAAGRVRTPALGAAFAAAGVPFTVWEAYDTVPLRPGLAAVEAATGGRAPDAVLLLSLGQVEAYQRLLALDRRFFEPSPRLLCLSRRIGEALPPELRLFSEISPRPSLAALFDCFL